MSCHQHCGAEAGGLAEGCCNRARVGFVEAAGGFVHEEEAGARGQGSGDGDALLFATGEGAGPSVGHLVEAEARQKLRHAGFAAPGRRTAQPQRQGHVFGHRQFSEQVEVLEDNPHMAAAQGSGRPGSSGIHGFAHDAHCASVGLLQSGSHGQQGGFARSAATLHHGNLPGGDVEVDATQSVRPARKRHADARHDQDLHGGATPAPLQSVVECGHRDRLAKLLHGPPRWAAVVVARLALQPDQRLIVATLGVAAALTLPLAGVLVLSGLDVEPGGEGWLVVRDDLSGLDPAVLGVRVDRAVAVVEVDGRLLASYVAGPAVLEPGRALAMPLAEKEAFQHRGLNFTPGGPRATHLDLVPGNAILLHPDDLGPAPVVAVLVPRAPQPAVLEEHGLLALPSRGSDSYAANSVRGLGNSAFVLIAASLPAVALTAAAFADLEARGRARLAATLSALGSPRAGRLVVLLRVAWMVVLGAGAAAATALGLYLFAGDAFHPRPLPLATLLAAGALPSMLGLAAGLWRAQKALGAGAALLRSPPTQREPPSRRVPGLPTQIQPLLLGTRLLPLMFLAAALLVVDLGFPLAAAGVPAAIAGGEDEVVIGARPGAVLGGQADMRRVAALMHDPDVERLVAEVLVPTAVGRHPVLLRGGQWAQLAEYHGVDLRRGSVPGEGEIALGQRLADRLGADVGDGLLVPAAFRPHARILEVSGIFRAPGMLADEGILPLATAQDLADLEADRVSVIRAGPDSEKLLRALERQDARIEVVDLRLEPVAPRAGQPVTVTIDLVNLGRNPGQRTLDVRVDGAVEASVSARVPGLGQETVSAVIVAPDGDFQVTVNPTRDVSTLPPDLILQGERIQFDDAEIVLRVGDAAGLPVANRTVFLHASLDRLDTAPLATATSDANGTARLPAQAPGAYVAVTRGQSVTALPVFVGDAAHASEAWVVVESLRVDPAVPRPGGEATLVATVRNVGGVAGSAELPVRVGNRDLPVLTVTLQPGQAGTLEAPAIFEAGATEAAIQSAVITVTARAPATDVRPDVGGVRSSATLQREVADEVLGDARATLAYLGATAAVASLGIVYLATDRSLRGRLHVLDALGGLGVGPEELRRRAAVEGAALGGGSFLMVAAAGWVAFQLPPIIGWPVAFGHALPNPVGVLVALQGAVAFAAASSLAAYAGASRILAQGNPLRREAAGADELEPIAVGRLLEWQP